MCCWAICWFQVFGHAALWPCRKRYDQHSLWARWGHADFQRPKWTVVVTSTSTSCQECHPNRLVFLPFRRIHDTDPFLVDSGNFVQDAYYLGGAAIMDDSTISKKRPFKLGRIKTIFCCSYPTCTIILATRILTSGTEPAHNPIGVGLSSPRTNTVSSESSQPFSSWCLWHPWLCINVWWVHGLYDTRVNSTVTGGESQILICRAHHPRSSSVMVALIKGVFLKLCINTTYVSSDEHFSETTSTTDSRPPC